MSMDEQRTNSYQHSTEEEQYYNAESTGIDEQEASLMKRCPWGKIVVATILIGIVTFVIIDSLTTSYISTGFEQFLGWIESNLVAGVFAFMAVYFIATVCFVPGSLLTLGSGFVFGSAVGVGYGVVLAAISVFVGASLGSIAAFLLGRYLLRDCVRQKLVKKYPVIEAIDEALINNGFKIFCLLRLSPIVPFVAINYIAGVTGMKLKDYVLALVGIIPGTVLYCFIGSTAGGLSQAEDGVSSTVTIISIVVGLVLAFIAVFVASYYAKKEFNKIVGRNENDDKESTDVETGVSVTGDESNRAGVDMD